MPQSEEAWQRFVLSIRRSLEQQEKIRYLQDRSMSLASQEMQQLHQSLAETNEKLEKSLEQLNRRVLYEQHLADCSRSLLSGGDASALDVVAVRVLRMANAGYVSVCFQDNYGESRTGRVIEAQVGDEPTIPPGCALMASMHDQTSRGMPVEIIPGPEETNFEGIARVRAFPIPLDGGNTGSMTIVDYDEAFLPADAIETAAFCRIAEMIGAFWTRKLTLMQLRDLVHSKDRFLATVSHEIRTPLTTILGMASLLVNAESNITEEEEDEFLNLIESQSTDLSNLVSDLLVAARAEIGTLAIRSESVNLGDESALVAATIRNRAEEEGKLISLDASESPVVTADSSRCRQILRNLVINAINYGGSTIVIGASVEGGWGVVEVRDDGEGIPAEKLTQIFDRYVSFNSKAPAIGSAGLGLHISRELARLMGGDLTVESDSETVFRLKLPLTEAVPQDSSTVAVTA